jgi:hypothetical protein
MLCVSGEMTHRLRLRPLQLPLSKGKLTQASCSKDLTSGPQHIQQNWSQSAISSSAILSSSNCQRALGQARCRAQESAAASFERCLELHPAPGCLYSIVRGICAAYATIPRHHDTS